MAYLIIYLCYEVSCVICCIIPAQNVHVGVSIMSFFEQRISRRVYQLPCLTWPSLSNIRRVSFSYNLARHCEHEFSLSRPRLTIVCRDSPCLNYTILKLDISSRLFMVSSRLFIVELRSHITEVSNVHEFNKPIHATVFKSTTNPGRFRTANQDSLFKFGRGTENVL